jgi:hypothetical protein
MIRRPRCSPTRRRTGTSTRKDMPQSKTTCSRRSCHRVQGRLLDRSLCDDHVLVPCIEPFDDDSPASPGEEDFRYLRSSASETLTLQAVRRPLNQPVAQSSDSRCCVSCKSVTIVHVANQANAKIYKMEVTKRKAINRTVLVLLAAVVPLAVAQSSTQGQDSPQQTQVRGIGLIRPPASCGPQRTTEKT